MDITTQRQLIQAVARRWFETYSPFKDDRPLFSWRTGVASPPLNKKQIYEKLLELDGDTATAEYVEATIGNRTWTTLICDQCRREVESLIMVGQEPDYESRTCSLCKECVAEAFAMSQEMP